MTSENNFKKTSTTFFDKKDFLKMGGTFLVALIIASSFNIFSKKIPTSISSRSVPVSLETMDNYNSDYNKFNPLHIRYVDTEGSTNYKYGYLQGFRFSTKDLDSIIHKNRSRLKGKKVIPDEIMFYLGQDGTYDHDGETYGNIRMIAVGVKDSVLLIPPDPADRGTMSKYSIYDKANPCPGPGCPTKPPPPHND